MQRACPRIAALNRLHVKNANSNTLRRLGAQPLLVRSPRQSQSTELRAGRAPPHHRRNIRVASSANEHSHDVTKKTHLDDMKACVPKHDFCLTFPWGAFVAALGVVGYVLRGSKPSLISGLTIGGALLASGVASLKSWSSGQSSMPWTASSAVTTLALTYVMMKKYLATSVVFPSGVLALGGCFMLAFYAKNLLVDGGNPPKSASASAGKSD